MVSSILELEQQDIELQLQEIQLKRRALEIEREKLEVYKENVNRVLEDAIKRERTDLGSNVLKQLAENIMELKI